MHATINFAEQQFQFNYNVLYIHIVSQAIRLVNEGYQLPPPPG